MNHDNCGLSESQRMLSVPCKLSPLKCQLCSDAMEMSFHEMKAREFKPDDLLYPTVLLKKDPARPDKSVDIRDLLLVHPGNDIARGVARYVCAYLKVPFIVSSLIRDRAGANFKTSVHQQGRGFDLRIWGWSRTQVVKFKQMMDHLLGFLVPPGMSVVVIEDDHIHVQVSNFIEPEDLFRCLDQIKREVI